MDFVVRITRASATLEFAGCGEDYIRDVCHGRCCRVSDNKRQKPLATVTDGEATAIAEHLGQGVDRISVRIPVSAVGTSIYTRELAVEEDAKGVKWCIGQDRETNLCRFHLPGVKPATCTISPWRISSKNTLYIMNRYKMLICFKDGPRMPAYKAFRAGLIQIFGDEWTEKITKHFDAGGGDYFPRVRKDIYEKLVERGSRISATSIKR